MEPNTTVILPLRWTTGIDVKVTYFSLLHKITKNWRKKFFVPGQLGPYNSDQRALLARIFRKINSRILVILSIFLDGALVGGVEEPLDQNDG